MLDVLLQVENLTVQYCPESQPEVQALNDVSFAVAPGEVVGLLGESGCGKTTLALSLLRLLPPKARVARGSIRFCGQEILALKERQLEKLRGARISMVFQEPGIALHPMLPVGEQIAEVFRAHSAWSRRRCREEAERMLAEVHLEQVTRIYAAYPHQLSGGQRQRVVIAQALACRPDLVIADEPTASLDSCVQAEILALLQELRARSGIAMLLISHNPAVLARLADRILVMYAGGIVERGSLAEIRAHPLHPYTRLLLGGIGGGNGQKAKWENGEGSQVFVPSVVSHVIPDNHSLCRPPHPALRQLTDRHPLSQAGEGIVKHYAGQDTSPSSLVPGEEQMAGMTQDE